jgi:hypothetical protein
MGDIFEAYRIPEIHVFPGASPPEPPSGHTGGLKAPPDSLSQIMFAPSNICLSDPTLL